MIRIEPLGDAALLVHGTGGIASTEDALDAVLALRDRLRAESIPGVIEITSAYSSVAVFYDPAAVAPAADADPDSIFEWLKARILRSVSAPGVGKRRPSRRRYATAEIPVCYDAEFAFDLTEVARRAGFSIDEVVARHARGEYRVQCVGFAPGFPYLSGLPEELASPRRATPRAHVPAGSVAIGGVQTGIYPQDSPGGWNVIGRTPACLFDPQRDPPTLLQAGDRVRFRNITRAEFDALRS